MSENVPAGWISVELRDGVIHARYSGNMNLELVEKAAKRIRELIPPEGKARVLYDTRQMKEPTRELTKRMLAFDDEIRPKVYKAATIAPDLHVAAQAKAAFVNSPDHEFFHELEPALQWIKA